jgi:hypothetical protein
MGVLNLWGVAYEVLDAIVTAAPSLRGMLFGYVTEYKLQKMWFTDSDTRFQIDTRPDNHDRKHKGDLWICYKGESIKIEVKGLQSNSVKTAQEGWEGIFQCDASDRRDITLPNGEVVNTTCLQVGEFDLLAVGLFQFGNEWRFAFVRNHDLPRCEQRNCTPEQRKYLIKTGIKITWPLRAPFEPEPFRLLDEIVQERSSETR